MEVWAREVEVTSYVRHIALVVPNLQEAEEYYQSLFQMELIGRETELDDGQWYTLPVGKGWEDANAAGIELKMTALRKGQIVLALFSGPHPAGQVFAIGLAMPRAQIAEVRSRLPPDTEVLVDEGEQFNFRDRYGIVWQLVPLGDEFLMYGESAGQWLEL
jgi:catechol 2,3-dioxygenase-like lactoylglutathione lyase family enzyme